ncbi:MULTISPECIES: site-specific DNA-methyltransferase [Bacillota]|uniref:Site-specific DNA-methyltransferase n=2 Tax=Clostridia TaxID=186801 RepID=A0ABY7AEL3_9FIRM|nr:MULTISPECIES: site-specific DNA-methyltransferase [Clostridia]KPU43457.1 putative methyltransferase [Oxobacter pfennigii]WAJ25164.1 site-specific DNA-methyltransferase [Lacrimispora xylanolytica]
MSEKLNRFVNLMKSIFELDKSDLDFGIYRIMNIRRDEIERFLTEGLPNKVQDTLAPFASNTVDIENRLAEIEKQCADLGIEISASPKLAEEYSRLKGQLTAGVDLSALETDVYSALYSFFNRYYDEGDFISKRRYKEGVYAIPYEGEEVKLYWANQDQYYIKTAENFKDYTFIDEGRKVHFRIVDATTEQNNNKESNDKKRTFMLYEETDEKPELKTMEILNGELYIRFVFDVPADKKIKYAEENYKKISAAISSQFKDWFSLLRPAATKDQKKVKSVLEKHLESYVAKNTFDYFIHKDLRGFLTRELDFFIKSEVIHLDDIDTTDEKRVDAYIAKVRAIKRVGKIIIDFVAQIENFQKKLWLKKKFVVSTDWCITLDSIDEAFYEEIIKNKIQVQEWVDMYAINEIEGDSTTVAYSEPLTLDFLHQNKNLIVDTKYFSTDFKDRLISSFENIEEQTGGLMFHSDNFQAINLLLEKYYEKIRLIYIDPPYNTDASKILYKNGYEHSSWISLMESRLMAAKKLISPKGIIEVAIDDYEFRYINLLLDEVFGINNAISNIAIFTNPKGRDQGFIAQAHDYTLLYAKDKRFAQTNNFILSDEEIKKKFSKQQGEQALRELPLKRTGTGKRREERPYMFFPFIYDISAKKLSVIPEDEYKKIYNPEDDTFNDDFVRELQKEYEEKGCAFLLPLSSKGENLRWRWGYKSCCKGCENGTLFAKSMRDGRYAVYQYDFADSEATPKSLWFGERYDASSKGTNILESILPNNPFDYPKSLYTVEDNIIIGSDEADVVLDFFAGSGTTGHAVININRTVDDSQRKYILVDMGEYFDSVIKARMKKVIYANDWENGKPKNRTTGVTHIMKYHHLESYEDALSNISLSEEKHKMSVLFGDEYLINYMFDVEAKDSMINLDSFKMPFSYKMKINENNETKEKIVDLCETFNYLIGINVVRQSVVSYFKTEPDKAGIYEGAVQLTEDIDGEFAFKQIEGILPDGRHTLIIWRTITDNLIESNAALDAYFNKHRINQLNREFDIIYVNGDNNLENLKADEEHWKVNMIEPEFKQRMFEEV